MYYIYLLTIHFLTIPIGFLQKHSDCLNKHSITLVDLQQKCTHSHAVEIARDLTEWRTTQTYLEIPKDDVEKIEANNTNDEAAMKLCLLEAWLKVHKERATYLKLFEALDLSNRTDLIEKGLKLLEEGKQVFISCVPIYISIV